MSLREKYGLPRRPSVWLRSAIVIVGGAILLTLLWLLMPHTAVGVALDAVLTLVIVFAGVFWALTGRDTEESEPGRVDAGGGLDHGPSGWPRSTQSQ
jgi:hypothetical protein